jgi:hypothetical protein
MRLTTFLRAAGLETWECNFLVDLVCRLIIADVETSFFAILSIFGGVDTKRPGRWVRLGNNQDIRNSSANS